MDNKIEETEINLYYNNRDANITDKSVGSINFRTTIKNLSEVTTTKISAGSYAIKLTEEVISIMKEQQELAKTIVEALKNIKDHND